MCEKLHWDHNLYFLSALISFQEYVYVIIAWNKCDCLQKTFSQENTWENQLMSTYFGQTFEMHFYKICTSKQITLGSKKEISSLLKGQHSKRHSKCVNRFQFQGSINMNVHFFLLWLCWERLEFHHIPKYFNWNY